MEPLAPNPLQKNLSKVPRRVAAQGAAAANESPWKIARHLTAEQP